MKWSKIAILRNILWYKVLPISDFGGSWAGVSRDFYQAPLGNGVTVTITTSKATELELEVPGRNR